MKPTNLGSPEKAAGTPLSEPRQGEHLIRLRGAWQTFGEGDATPSVKRWTLPIQWPPGATGNLRLVRRFSAPPVDRETVILQVDAVPGLTAAALNDQAIIRPAAEAMSFRVVIDDILRPRNTLVLEVDLAAASASSAVAWGEIALVIVPIS
jgi:hypothetical protein